MLRFKKIALRRKMKKIDFLYEDRKMNTLIDIESFHEFRNLLSRIEDELPYASDLKNQTEEEKKELKIVTYNAIIELFKDYIDWLIDEHEPDRKHQTLYIRKAYDLLWDDRVRNRIETLLEETRGRRGDLWKKFKHLYEEKLAK